MAGVECLKNCVFQVCEEWVWLYFELAMPHPLWWGVEGVLMTLPFISVILVQLSSIFPSIPTQNNVTVFIIITWYRSNGERANELKRTSLYFPSLLFL